MRYFSFRCSSFAFAVIIFAASSSFADEGMWLFSNPPLKQLKEKYHFEPTPQWLDHLQKSSVRFNSGGSGSFVSSNRPPLQNHHLGRRTPPQATHRKDNSPPGGVPTYERHNA